MLMIKKLLFSCFAVFVINSQVFSQADKITSIRKYLQANEHPIINEFVSFLGIPNVSTDSANIVRNADFIMQAMSKRNIKNIQLLYPVTSKAFPAVYGEVMVPGSKQTIIFYAHYDGQPVTASQWAKGLEPFKAALYSASLEQQGMPIDFPSTGKSYDPQWRIYARGASDDKAGVMAIINAYDAIIKTGMQPTVNIKFFFESEEEAGSGIYLKYCSSILLYCKVIAGSFVMGRYTSQD